MVEPAALASCGAAQRLAPWFACGGRLGDTMTADVPLVCASVAVLHPLLGVLLP